MFDNIRSGNFWTVLGGIVAILSLLFSAYQFYQAAALSKRTVIAGLALEAHEHVYDFASQVNQYYGAKQAFDSELKNPNNDPIHPEIRLALVRVDGAISRAQIIDQVDIYACLITMRRIAANIVEGSISSNKPVNIAELVLDLDDFPKMVGRYIEGLKMLPDHHAPQNLNSNQGDPFCKIFDEAEY